jgi:hypothetical protein
MTEAYYLKCPHIAFEGCRWLAKGTESQYCVYGAFVLPDGRSVAIEQLKQCPILETNKEVLICTKTLKRKS